MKKSELSAQGPEVIRKLVCRLVDAKRLKPKYFIEPMYKVIVFLMRFMSYSLREKIIESLYA
jgi:hypothetical protein